MDERTATDRRGRLALHGEDLAAEYLVDGGMHVVARRWRRRYGELDLVAVEAGTVVFVEVKTRSGDGFGGAEAVTRAKQRRLALAALGFLDSRRWHDRPCRFDVVEIVIAPRQRPRIRHFRDAFRPSSRTRRDG